jgi:alanine dehydrogenase
MIVGIPRETSRHDHRVGLTPFAVARLKDLGCSILVEHDAGAESHFRDADYVEAGGQVVYDPEEIHGRSDVVCQVSPVSLAQASLLRPESAVCGFMHVGVMPMETLRVLHERRITLLGWEAVEDREGAHPIRGALSEIAGALAVQWGGHLLQADYGGRGIILGNVAGIAPATFVVLGAGVAGWSAARLALAHRSHVIVLDLELDKLREASVHGCEHAVTAVASQRNLRRYVPIADVLLGAVAAREGRTPHLISDPMVRSMKPGSVILDLSIDEGGCVETSRPTSLDRPTFEVHGVTHFCVPNMTAAVPRTASRAISLAAAPYLASIARRGFDGALRSNPGLARGVSLHRNRVFHEHAASVLGVEPEDPLDDGGAIS